MTLITMSEEHVCDDDGHDARVERIGGDGDDDDDDMDCDGDGDADGYIYSGLSWTAHLPR